MELKNLINEKTTAIESIYSRIDETDARISDLENVNFSITQSKGKKKNEKR